MLSILPLTVCFPRRGRDVNVQVDQVQMVPDGFGFHLQASEPAWFIDVETGD
jgi:hypothetical protein